MRRRSLIPFFACGAVSTAVTLATVSWLLHDERHPPAHRVITMAMNAGEDPAGGPTSWDTIQESQFRNYAQKQGWADVAFVMRTFVGSDTEKYVAAQIAGAGPDIVIASREQLAFFDDQGLIEPLDGYLEQWSDYQDGQLDLEVLDACRGRGGEVLGLPVYENAPGVFAVRRDWLDKLGRAPPRTFDEARDYWRACTFEDPDGNGRRDTYGYELTMDSDGGHLYSLAPFLFAVRAPWYRRDEERGYVAAFNTPAAARVLEFIRDCYREGLFGDDVMVRPPGSATYRFFARRRSGMTGPVFADWYRSVAEQNGMIDRVQVVPFLWPDDQARRTDTYGACTYLTRLRCMMKASRDKQLSWRYFEYFFSREWMGRSFDHHSQPYLRGDHLGHFGLYSTETPWRPLRRDVSTRQRIDPKLARQVEQVDPYVIRVPLMASWPRASSAICEVIVDFYNDRYPTAAEALDEAERRFDAILRGP
ncbi:MAG: hypothetical protein CMJ18_04295 [Phycisphaeraceae bacterium]|nr:hypothetical protein [Phycisphaeraceae bacterium]